MLNDEKRGSNQYQVGLRFWMTWWGIERERESGGQQERGKWGLDMIGPMGTHSSSSLWFREHEILELVGYKTSILTIRTSSSGFSLYTRTFSIRWTTSMPRTARPNIVCFLSSHDVFSVVMKN